MYRIRHQLNRLTWLSLVLMLVLALVPTVSRALASVDPGGPWAEVCSVGGSRLVLADAGADSQAPGATSHLDHCPLCGVGAGPLGLPVEVATHAAPRAEAARWLTWPPSAVPVLHGWTTVRPRGPPHFS